MILFYFSAMPTKALARHDDYPMQTAGGNAPWMNAASDGSDCEAESRYFPSPHANAGGRLDMIMSEPKGAASYPAFFIE